MTMSVETASAETGERERPARSWQGIKGVITSAVDAILNTVVFAALALGLGLWTSWVAVDRGSSLTTRTSGAWTLWTGAGRSDADPYTRAHFTRTGGLPLSTTAFQTWEARADDDSQRLHSSCEYILEGNGLASDWWSLAVYDEKGALIPNPAARFAYNSNTVALGADGAFIVTLARDARPGNWLPTGGAGSLVLVLTRPAVRPNATAAETEASYRGLPLIRRVGCR